MEKLDDEKKSILEDPVLEQGRNEGIHVAT